MPNKCIYFGDKTTYKQHKTVHTHHIQSAGRASVLTWWGKPTLISVWSILTDAGGGSRCSKINSFRWTSLMETEKDPPVSLLIILQTCSSAEMPTTETRMLESLTFCEDCNKLSLPWSSSYIVTLDILLQNM